jgi:uncharacterized protein (DUF924 family)
MKRASAVLDFWFGAPGSAEAGRPRKAWFQKNPDFDREIRTRFGALQSEAAVGRLDAWQASPRGALALIVMLDQFPRNMFRDTPAAFACDAKALAHARCAVRRGFDRDLAPTERVFVYLPFEHAEDIATQRESMRLFNGLKSDPASAGNVDYAQRHFDIIARFGRFPHRNRILGRTSTAEETVFLSQPGSGF